MSQLCTSIAILARSLMNTQSIENHTERYAVENVDGGRHDDEKASI